MESAVYQDFPRPIDPLIFCRVKGIRGHDAVFVIDASVVDDPRLLSAVVHALYSSAVPVRGPAESACDYLTRVHGAQNLIFTPDQAQILISAQRAAGHS